ncbi:MAG: T9SS type A sorting domain-containing protein, partial [Ignavibacteriaceae bacterium]
MKKIITLLFFLLFIGTSIAQQASDYFPSQTGFEWKFKAIPLDSVSNPINNLAYYRIDNFESTANYQGKLANIVLTKSGPLGTILLQPYLDSLFYNTEGTTGYEYFSIRNIEAFLISLDSLGVAPNFSFLSFFTSLQDWYDNYRFASPTGTEYTLLQRDTTITISSLNVPLRFKYSGKRLLDETIPTVLGNFDCKKFLLQWKVTAYSVIELLTLSDTIWIAPNNWIVQDIIPGQYVDNLTFLGVDPFSIPGLDTKLSDEIVTVENEGLNPNDFLLEQNYPNPFNPSTKIRFVIASTAKQSQFVTLKVYNILGNEVATLVNEEKSAGNYEVEFDATGLPSGIYFYKLHAGNFVETKKMVLLQ